MLTILEGSTFCICDERGDVDGDDATGSSPTTRGSSRCFGSRSTACGRCRSRRARSSTSRPRSTCGTRSPATCRTTSLSIVRDALRRRRRCRTGSRSATSRWSRSVPARDRGRHRLRGHLRRQGPRLRARRPACTRSRCPSRVRTRFDADGNQFVLERRGDGAGRTQVILSAAGRVERHRHRAGRSSSRRASAGSSGSTCSPHSTREPVRPRRVERRFGEELARVRDSLAAWHLRVPQMRASWDTLSHVVRPVGVRPRVAADARRDGDRRQAAGRRDALVHDRLRPRHAHHLPADAALRPGARAQRARRARRAAGEGGRPLDRRRAREDRPRGSPRARRRANWFHRYYGTLDATPLYLVLLSEVWRWTDDAPLVRELKEPALAALALDRRVRRPRRRRLRRVPAPRAERARHQSWKDSGDSQRFHDGRSRRVADRARARCRATSTTRSGAWPSSPARSGATARSPTGSSARRRSCSARFDEALLGRGARRLLRARARRARSSGSTRSARTSATCSGRGIVPPERVDAIVDRLMGEELWSGWGVRTMSAADAGVQPAQLPQRHGLAARQLPDRLGARAGRALAARRSGSPAACSTRPRHFGYQLPEVFAGLPRAETPFPIAYPTAARPQAWAAGHAGAAPPAAARLAARPATATARVRSRRRAALLGGRHPAHGRPRVRPPVGRARRGRARAESRRAVKLAVLAPGLVPGPADRLRRDRVGRLAARRRARRTPATR